MGKGLGRFNKFIFLCNMLFAFLLLMACINRFLFFGFFSFLSFPSLFLPYLVAVNLFFLLYWGVRKRKQFWLSFLLLVFGYLTQEPFYRVFGSNEVPGEGEVGVLTFNVHGFSGLQKIRNKEGVREMADFVKQQEVDIVCFQEHYKGANRELNDFPYKYETPDIADKSIQAIYSKYPIMAKGLLDFPNSKNNAIYADVLIGKDTLRVYNIHLQSFQVRPRSFRFKEETPDRLFNRLNESFRKQQQQADLIKEHASKVGYRKIICGDLNNTQFSNMYNTIKGDMKDSFHEKGSGLGNTYDFKFLPFRIDFILVDQGLEVQSHKNFNVRMSDHTPVRASFRLQ